MKKIYVIICLLMLGFGLFTPVFGQAVPLQVPPESFKTGLNYSSQGDRYAEGDLIYDADFSLFKENHVTYISIQLKWKSFIIDSQSSVTNQVWDETTINNIKLLLDKANQYNLKVQLDFWFHCHSFSTYWRPSYTGSEPLDIVRDSVIKQAWLDFVEHLTQEFANHPAVYSFTSMNEPFYDDANDRPLIETFLADTYNAIKQHTNKPVTPRFTASYTPFNYQFSMGLLDYCDFVGITEYLDPFTNDATEQQHWIDLEKAVDWCNNNSKEFWIFEFGYDPRPNDEAGGNEFTTSEDEEQRQFYHDTIDKFYLTGITTCLAWQWRSRSPLLVSHPLNYGIADPRPAFYELSYIAKSPSQDFELNFGILVLAGIGIVSFMFLRGKK